MNFLKSNEFGDMGCTEISSLYGTFSFYSCWVLIQRPEGFENGYQAVNLKKKSDRKIEKEGKNNAHT